MGIVLKQGLKNTVFTYLGFLIGSIYTVLLIPKVFDTHPEHWGAATYLISYAGVIFPWAQLSLPSVIIKYFPVFKEKKKGEFLFLIFFFFSIGILISSLIVYFFSGLLFGENTDPLLLENRNLVLPIFIGISMMEVASSISNSYFKSTFPIFLKEVFLRLSSLVLILLYHFGVLAFDSFILWFAYNYLIVIGLLLIYLLKIKALSFKFNLEILSDKDFHPIYSYAFFGLMSSAASNFALNIDTLMINHFMGLKEVAIYKPALFLTSAIMIPIRAISSIISPVIADNWAKNNIEGINDLYKKSATGPLTITILIFLLIWINIDLMMDYFGPVFGQIKYIVLVLSLAQMFNVATGVNYLILSISNMYKVEFLLLILHLIILSACSYFLIPAQGLMGAATAFLISVVINNVVRTIYLYQKFKIHPFSKETGKLMLVFGVFFVITTFFSMYNFNYLIAISGVLIISFLYGFIIFKLSISPEINKSIGGWVSKYIKGR